MTVISGSRIGSSSSQFHGLRSVVVGWIRPGGGGSCELDAWVIVGSLLSGGGSRGGPAPAGAPAGARGARYPGAGLAGAGQPRRGSGGGGGGRSQGAADGGAAAAATGTSMTV